MGGVENAGKEWTYPVSPVAGIITIRFTVEIFHHGEGQVVGRIRSGGFLALADWVGERQRLGGSTPGCWKPRLLHR